MRKYEYWKAQNTGWSGGASWFDNVWQGNRYRTREEAEVCAEKYKKRLPNSKHRIVHVIAQEESFEI